MPSTTGTATTFQGVLTALLAYVASATYRSFTAESLGTPNGVLVTFSGTMTNVAIIQSSFVVDYTIGTTPYVGTTDSAGNITGTNITSGSIAIDGTYSITFSTAPDDASALTADYNASCWNVELNQNAKTNALPPVTDTTWGAGTREVILRSTGTSGNDDVIIGIREVKYPTGSLYGWNLNGYKVVPDADILGWNGNRTETLLDGYTTAAENWNDHPFLNFADATMAYWFTVTPDYITVTVRVSSDYFTCYLGNGKRLMEPSLYPHPLCISGTSYNDYNYQSINNGGPVRPYHDWNFFAIASYPNEEYLTNTNSLMHPMDSNTDNTNVGQTDALEIFLHPAFCFGDSQVMFELDGMVSCRKDSIQSEDVITDGVDTYIVFQQSANLSNYNYLAIKQV